MLTSLTLPALAVLIGFPFGIPIGKLSNPFARHPHVATAADTLPPLWKPASRLALEDQFVLATLRPLGPRTSGLKLQQDPRQLSVGFDPDSATVSAVAELGAVPLGR